MKYLFFTLFLALATASQAQFVLKEEKDSLQFYARWSHEKWYSKKSPDVLLIKVVNLSPTAKSFDLGIEFFAGLVLVEESEEFPFCIGGKKKLKPRVHGLVFKPAQTSKEKLDSFELKGLEIKAAEGGSCK